MAIEGPLRELSIHDVFQLLDLSRETGVVTVSSRVRQNRGSVYFEQGAIVHARIDSNPHPLGAVLLRAGKVTEADLQRAAGMQQRGDKRRLGEILVAIGSLSRRELDRQVRLQIEEVVFEIMSWREGYFAFLEGPLTDIAAEATVRIPTGLLLLEATRRIDEWSRIAARVPHTGIVPVLAAANEEGSRLELLAAEWELLAVVNGERDLRAIGELLGRSEFDTARTAFGLESAGLIQLVDESDAAGWTGDAGPDFESLLERAVAALEAGDVEGAEHWAKAARVRFPDEPMALVVAGRAHLLSGRPAEAEQEFRKALTLDPLIMDAHRLLGDALVRLGRLAEAVDWWNRWLTLASQSEEHAEEARLVQNAVRAAGSLARFLEVARG
jgi:hypothetical protein